LRISLVDEVDHRLGGEVAVAHVDAQGEGPGQAAGRQARRGISVSGRLSIASKPRSSSTLIADDRPAPEGPLTRTTLAARSISLRHDEGASSSRLASSSVQYIAATQQQKLRRDATRQ
jgi:hypothetical protein